MKIMMLKKTLEGIDMFSGFRHKKKRERNRRKSMNQTTLIESFHQGHCIDAYELFGAHFTYERVNGVRFTVYAPHARSVRSSAILTVGMARTRTWSGCGGSGHLESVYPGFKRRSAV